MNAKTVDMGRSLWKRLFGRLRPTGNPAPKPPAIPPRSTSASSEALAGLDDPFQAIRFGYLVIVVGIGSFIVWATTAPIDEGVSAQGSVVVESQRKTIAHLTGGTVASINVRENQHVNAGDVLMALDPTRARVAYDSLVAEYVTAEAKLARLVAEQRFATKVEFPVEIVHQATEIGREDILQGQVQLFKTRQQAMESEQAILRENLSASGSQATGVRQQLAARRRQIELLSEELRNNRPLAEEGYLAKNRLLEQERQLAELSSIASDLHARIAKESSSAAEIRLRLLQRRQEYLKEVETAANESRREVTGLTERLKDARLELERTTLHAPVTGQVVSLVAQAPGSIITPGMRLMEIVPAGDKLLLDIHVPINVAHRVKPGTLTDVRIAIFPETPNLIVEGKVQSISTDRHEPPNVQPYYLARVEVTPDGIAKLHGRQLRPGMAVDVVIKTGERSFMAYLVAPLNRRLFEAFREQ